MVISKEDLMNELQAVAKTLKLVKINLENLKQQHDLTSQFNPYKKQFKPIFEQVPKQIGDVTEFLVKKVQAAIQAGAFE